MSWGTLLFALLVATGAGYRLAYEKHVRNFKKYDPDRLIWLAYSAVLFIAAFAWPIYEIYDQLHFIEVGKNLSNRQHPSVWVWIAIPILVTVTWVAGHLCGLMKLHWQTLQFKTRQEEDKMPTSFDFAMQTTAKRRGKRKGMPTEVAPLLWIVIKGHEGTIYYVIGRPRYASPPSYSSTSYPQDIYVEPLYFHGTEDEWKSDSENGSEMTPLGGGTWVRTDNILFIRLWKEDEATKEGKD